MITNPLYNGLLSELYDTSWYGKCSQEEINFFLSHTTKKTTLEIGSGTGRISIPLLNAGCNLYGLEGSAAMLKKLLCNPALKPTDTHRFTLWNVLDTPFKIEKTKPIDNNIYDAIIIPFSSFALIHHRAMPSFDNSLMKELARIMKPEGILIINDWRTHHVIDKEKLLHTSEYFAEELPQGFLEIEHKHFYQCPNQLFPEQIVKLRHSIFLKNNRIIEENIEDIPFWDTADFRVLGEDAGLLYLRHEYCEYHLQPSVHHFYKKPA